MQIDIRRVLLIANLDKEESNGLAAGIRTQLEQDGVELTVFGYRAGATLPTLEGYDLAISLGGDGTVLFSARILSVGQHSTPILPVNLGDFGFITEVKSHEWYEEYKRFRSGDISAGRRLLLSVHIKRADKEIANFVGLNDAVISAAGISKLVRLSVYLSDTFLGNYRADGMIVATPTGSTAYSAAAGGPILHPEMEAIILNPICPFTLSHRPLVVPADEDVLIKLRRAQRTSVIITVDGQSEFPLRSEDRIEIRAHPGKAYIIRSHQRTFYEVLRRKLGWSGDANA